MSRNFCAGCGNTLPVHARFCAVCGTQVNPGSNNTCQNCGTPHASPALFCKNCGFRFGTKDLSSPERTTCRICGSLIPETALYCYKCGEKVIGNGNNGLCDIKKETASENNQQESKTETETAEKPSDIYPGTHPSEKKTYKTKKPKSGNKIKITVFILASATVFCLIIFVLYTDGLQQFPFGKPKPYDPEASVYAADMVDWQNSPDLKKEQNAIAKRQRELISFLKKSNIDKAVKYLQPDIQSEWQKRMNENPEDAAVLADVLSTAEMTFLGRENTIKDNPRSRTASFSVVYEQNIFLITWIKSNGTWYLYEF